MERWACLVAEKASLHLRSSLVFVPLFVGQDMSTLYRNPHVVAHRVFPSTCPPVPKRPLPGGASPLISALLLRRQRHARARSLDPSSPQHHSTSTHSRFQRPAFRTATSGLGNFTCNAVSLLRNGG